ncbi:MAG: hydroxyacid dehydrogenase, partial [Treponema sp.]|nr:hydroxyacid dehydrogenase [Treponema sp.]
MAEADIHKIPMGELMSKYARGDSRPGEGGADSVLEAELRKNQRKIIVLDDDPTGVQTVHGISVYTSWDKESIEAGFDETNSLFFILTNSRGMTEQETAEVHACIAGNIASTARKKNRDFILISRSDSTLRGHYPLETLTLKKNLEDEILPGMAAPGGNRFSEIPFRFDGEIICPFFMEGGRYTAGNVHYVKTGDTLVPAAQTEFAADKTFGYHHSDLTEWVEEKTRGAFKKKNVLSVSLEDLRSTISTEAKVEKIAALLADVKDFNKVIVNALDYEDIKIFSAAFYRALAGGKRFMLRTAAAIPKVLGGVKD